MPGAHAPLSPSAAKRWLTCPPSARLNAKLLDRFGEKSSTFAEEGTKAHSLSELKLRKEIGEINAFRFGELKKALGDIPAEMERNTDRYVDEVLERFYAARQRTPDAQLYVEQRVDIITDDSDFNINTILNEEHQREALIKMAEDYIYLNPPDHQRWLSSVVSALANLGEDG